MDIHEIRKRNLRALIPDINEHGSVAAFARQHNLDPTYVRQILKDHRRMGEKAARKFEETLKLKSGELDAWSVKEEPGIYATSLSPTAISVAAAFEASSPELKEAALRMLGVVRRIDTKEGEK